MTIGTHTPPSLEHHTCLVYLPVLVVSYGYSHTHFALQTGSTSQEELADNVVLKQFLDRIILDRIPIKGGLDPHEKHRAMV